MKKNKGMEKSKIRYASGRAVITRRGVFAFARKLGQKLGADFWQRVCNYFLVFLPVYTLATLPFSGGGLSRYMQKKICIYSASQPPCFISGGIFPALCHKNCIFYKPLSGKQF